MELVTPGIGLVFWTTIVFLSVLLILSKFAWKPILTALSDREKSIEDALQAAARAKEDMVKLKAENEALLQEARFEKDKIMKEAKKSAEKIIAQAQETASAEANKMIVDAKVAIEAEKKAALAEVKHQVATLTLEVTEKLLRRQLESKESQKALVNQYLNELKAN